MRAAQRPASVFDTPRTNTNRNLNDGAYTGAAAGGPSDDPTAESGSQDSLNASV
jgi:hypothetical protein